MEKKPDTERRISRRRYEEKHKEERKAANGTFSTSITRMELDEIEDFLKQSRKSKAELVRAGYRALLEQSQLNKR